MNSKNSRRQFLKQSCTLTGGIFIAPYATSKPYKSSFKWGIITNTVWQEMKEDFRSTLEQLANMGYTFIEGSIPGDSIEEYGKILKNLKLKSIASGASMGDFPENLDRLIEQAHILQQKYIVCYWPWLSSANNLTMEECLQTAERINKIGKHLRREGLRLAWHNHDKEFTKIGDQLAFDILMQNTDPAYSTVQLDWYWVFKGKQDPVSLFKKYPGRFELAHVKDMDTFQAGNKACVGEGQIDFIQIFDHAELAGLKYPIVEHDDGA